MMIRKLEKHPINKTNQRKEFIQEWTTHYVQHLPKHKYWDLMQCPDRGSEEIKHKAHKSLLQNSSELTIHV